MLLRIKFNSINFKIDRPIHFETPVHMSYVCRHPIVIQKNTRGLMKNNMLAECVFLITSRMSCL